MVKYSKPEMELVLMTTEDIILSSTQGGSGSGENDLDKDEWD